MKPGAVARAAAYAVLARDGRLDLATVADAEAARTADPDPRVRAAALGALGRGAPVAAARASWLSSVDDPAPAVRRRAAELAPDLARRSRSASSVDALTAALVGLLADGDVTVVEAAAWAVGELDPTSGSAAAADAAVAALARTAADHPDALGREAAVAALGARGSEGGRAAILGALDDRPAVRRRAVLALAAFEGPDVDAALTRARADRDWQVRQAAEDLLEP